MARDIMSHFREHIDDYHDAVIAVAFDDWSNKVYGDIPPSLQRNWQGLQGTLIFRPRCVVSHAHVAVFDKLGAIFGQIRPEVVSRDGFIHLVLARMSRLARIVDSLQQ